MPKMAIGIVAFAVSAVLALVAWNLVETRAAAGELYPSYSSHRAGPDGLKALYDVVAVAGRSGVRAYTPLTARETRDSLILRLGLSPGTLVGAAFPTANGAESLASAGNTVVLGLAGECMSAAIKQWNAKMQCFAGQAYFSGDGWTPLFGDVVNGLAQVVERRFGAGAIVLLGDRKLLTNRWLAEGTHGQTLATLLERHRTVVFDEGHLGVEEALTTGALIRQYRLHGLVLVLALLFALFVWKNASTFLPRIEGRRDQITGRDTGSGLANILRRTVASRDLLPVALAEWTKLNKSGDRAEELKLIAMAHTEPADAYNAVAAALRRKRIID